LSQWSSKLKEEMCFLIRQYSRRQFQTIYGQGRVEVRHHPLERSDL